MVQEYPLSGVWNVEQEVSFYFVRKAVDVHLPGDEDLVITRDGADDDFQLPSGSKDA